MKYDIASIENSSLDNAGGLCSFVFAPKEWLASDVSLSTIGNNVLANITFSGIYEWLTAKCMQDTMGFSEVPEVSAAGTKYIQTIVGEINGDDADVLQLMNALPYYEYVVVYTDRQGLRKLIGNKQKGMRLQAVFSTGEKYIDKRSYQFTLVHESAERAASFPF